MLSAPIVPASYLFSAAKLEHLMTHAESMEQNTQTGLATKQEIINLDRAMFQTHLMSPKSSQKILSGEPR